MSRITQHRVIQAIAKQVLAELGPTLIPTDSEQSIVLRAMRMLAEFGIRQTWYHNCPVRVLAGDRTCLSQSGRDYIPSTEEIGPKTLITVDLSPTEDGIWGDCARSLYIEDGLAARSPKSPEFLWGLQTLSQLHTRMQSFTTPDTTFDQLCEFTKSQMAELGCVHLDFRGNIGHTIETELSRRDFIEPGNTRRLESAELFTFEPHIKAIDGRWGFKHEEIYYFVNGKLEVL